MHDAQVANASAQSAGDNAWMLTSAALVLLMTGPGLALFYGGLVRKKNILGTMMQSFAMMGLVTILWAIVGYSLAFGHGNVFVGGFEHLFLRGVSLNPNPDYAATIPEQTYMIYQLMFAIITPALITGAFAERMKFSSMALFLSLWSLLVYCPMAHMVWGVGGLLNATGNHIPSLDFAGGTVVHITSGVSALVCALYLGKRIGYPAHGHAAALHGAELHWRVPAVGGLVRLQRRQRPGSQPAGHQRLRQYALRHGRRCPGLDHLRVDSQRQAHGAGRYLRRGRRPRGHHAGFGVCPADVRALLIGLAAGFFCSFMVFKVKSMFGYDDSLDAFGVHGGGGTLGAVLTGIFAASVINPIYGKGVPTGAHRRALEPGAESARRRRHRLGNLHRRHAGSALCCGQDRGAARRSRARDGRARSFAARRGRLRFQHITQRSAVGFLARTNLIAAGAKRPGTRS